MTEKKRPAPRFDWAAIERDYRTGQYSNRELSRLHGPSEGAIRARAKEGGWTRDLSEQIRQRVREKTGRAIAQEIVKAETDAEIVEQAAEVGAGIVRGHQRILNRSRDQLEQLQGRIDSMIADAKEKPEVIARTLSSASQALERTIRLQRQAYGLDDEDAGKTAGKSLDELLAEVAE